MGFALIAYGCTAPGHQSTPDHADRLTIHQGAWAYCPFDALAAGHVWHETGGIDVDTLVRRGRRVLVSETPTAVPET